MSKPLSEQHVYDYRPRFIEDDHELIQVIAKRKGILPNALLRSFVKDKLREYRYLLNTSVGGCDDQKEGTRNPYRQN